MMIRAIAIDDEPPALEIIRNFCSRTDFISLENIFSGVEEARQYLKTSGTDLVFLDIQMPSMNGLDFCKQLPEHVMVIFMTAFSEYAVQGFDLKATDYLLKPFTFQRFLQAAETAKQYYSLKKTANQEQPDNMLIRSNYSLVKIYFQQILFAESMDDYIKIYLENQKPVLCRMTMKLLTDKLPAADFIRVHRSYLVSLKRIDSFRNKTISIGQYLVPVGNLYEETFLAHYTV